MDRINYQSDYCFVIDNAVPYLYHFPKTNFSEKAGMTITIQENYSLKALNTFGVDARARWFTRLNTPQQIETLLAHPTYQQNHVLWLGGGSNLLLRNNTDMLVAKIAFKGITVIKDNYETLVIEAAAGEPWSPFVQHTLNQGWYGLENLSLIPGTVGAASIQNIGAYGREAKDVIDSVICCDLPTGNSVNLAVEACHFGYRDSIFKQPTGASLLVTAVRFRLHRDATAIYPDYGDIRQALQQNNIKHPEPTDIAKVVINLRQQKLPDPAQLGNAGSFFKNPVVDQHTFLSLQQQYPAMPYYPSTNGHVKLAAGWLIEQAGFKGYRIGDAGVHQHQALVLVNYGHATGEEIYHLACIIQKTVKQRYGVELHAEPVII